MHNKSYNMIRLYIFTVLLVSAWATFAQDCTSIGRALDREYESLQEYRRTCRMEIAYNQVCSKCQRTKSQVEEQERKPFRTHVSEVQGVVESSPYTRVNADATFEAFYQEKLLDLEQRRTDHLEVCSDLKNRSYFEKTDSYESDNEEVRARTESLQDAVSDKRPFDATAADEIDFDGNRDKNELTCQELDERVNELDQRCHTLKARMLDTHPLLEEAQGLLRQLHNSKWFRL